jgi:hypothetical protein
MSASTAQQLSRSLKSYLQLEGMRWKSRAYILRNPRRDRRVVAALRNSGIRLCAEEIQHEVVSVMRTAIILERRGELRNADSTYDFVLAVR